jgi:hypothetical protein
MYMYLFKFTTAIGQFIYKLYKNILAVVSIRPTIEITVEICYVEVQRTSNLTEYWSCPEQINLKLLQMDTMYFEGHDLSEFGITEIRLYLLVNTVYVICLI